MKKLILSLLCVGSILALLPGCCHDVCEEPCEDYCDDYDDCYNDCDDRCDKEVGAGAGYVEENGIKYYHRKRTPLGHKHSAGEAYTEENGTRYYHDGRSNVKVTEMPKKQIYHKPVHPAVIETAERHGRQIKYMDSRYDKHNKGLAQAAQETSQPKRNNGRKMMEAEVMEEMSDEA